MNERLGSEAIEWIRSPVLEAGNDGKGIDALMDRLHAGDVDALVVAGLDAASCLSSRAFEAALGVVPFTAYLGHYEDRTARASAWFVPLAHPLESWGATRADDGTIALAQPLIEPLFDGRTIAELVHAVTSDEAPRDAHALTVRAFGEAAKPGDWERALATGVVEGTAARAEKVAWRADDVAKALSAAPAVAEQRGGPLELALHPDPAVHDGRFAAAPALLELPEPCTQVAWTNTATMSGATAKAANVTTADVVVVSANGREIELPVFVADGMADGVVAVALGWGLGAASDRTGAAGADAYRLQKDPGDAVAACTISRTGRKALLPRSQLHASLEGRAHEIFRTRRPGDAPAEAEPRRLTLYEPPAPAGHAWGMTIDLGACLGCNACVAACQAENNVPVVGPHGVDQGRIMHWLRIDRYDLRDGDSRVVGLMPMLCQQCEKAPCEYVCPVEATTHSRDGLNDMVYNRCVGTRFCSNNCPYKVRRFNWFDYHQHDGPLEALGHNPEVTVRARGVMEKCTFCVQRIRGAEHAAGVQGRPLGRDEVTTACAEACPTEAIVFGDLADPGSRVAGTRKDSALYSALGDLGTEPRVKYAPRLRNPNPELG
jgi:molybdopterin-containing oxidoreductase family iron-sulfur binding subunit